MPLRRPPALVLEQPLSASPSKSMQFAASQRNSPSVKSSSLLVPPMLARVPLSPLSNHVVAESPAARSRGHKSAFIRDAVLPSHAHSSAVVPGTPMALKTPSYLASFDYGWSSPMIRSSSLFTPNEPDVTNALGLRGMHVPYFMTNVMYAMRQEMGSDARHEGAQDIAFQAELYSKEEPHRIVWLDSFLEVHKSTGHLQEAILVLRTLCEEEPALNDSLLELCAGLKTLHIRLNEFYQSATLKWQSRVPDPPESIESAYQMVNSLAGASRPLDSNYHAPMIDSLTIDVSMDIIVFGDLDHPRHQQRATIVNEGASDCPPASYFLEDRDPSLEYHIDDCAGMSPIAPLKRRRAADLSKPPFIGDSIWLEEPSHSPSSPSLSPR